MLVCPVVLAFSINHRRIVRRVETCGFDLNKMLVCEQPPSAVESTAARQPLCPDAK
jgi:hypothetical protein